ncbi:MAG: hypothetical protein L0H31_11805 [Nocardioidaceae bacterium]|nr:hypothetical protein [Nocardioidaceae bacterium]
MEKFTRRSFSKRWAVAVPVLAIAAAASLVLSQQLGLPWQMEPWPGNDEVVAVKSDVLDVENISGLAHQAVGPNAAGTLWAVRNNPATLFRLSSDAGTWRATKPGWEDGMALSYSDRLGSPDAEGIALAKTDSEENVYVAAERNNDDPDVSALHVLRYETARTSESNDGTLVPAQQWDLTDDVATAADPNEGFEGIAFVPDEDLTAAHFNDERTGSRFEPAAYGSHGGGVFFLGLEATGVVYGYVLAADGSYERVATIDPKLPIVAELEYDSATGRLWAICDNACRGQSAVLEIGPSKHSSTNGFTVVERYKRPQDMPNINNEGFAISDACTGNLRPVYWSDDDVYEGHTLRMGMVECV